MHISKFLFIPIIAALIPVPVMSEAESRIEITSFAYTSNDYRVLNVSDTGYIAIEHEKKITVFSPLGERYPLAYRVPQNTSALTVFEQYNVEDSGDLLITREESSEDWRTQRVIVQRVPKNGAPPITLNEFRGNIHPSSAVVNKHGDALALLKSENATSSSLTIKKVYKGQEIESKVELPQKKKSREGYFITALNNDGDFVLAYYTTTRRRHLLNQMCVGSLLHQEIRCVEPKDIQKLRRKGVIFAGLGANRLLLSTHSTYYALDLETFEVLAKHRSISVKKPSEFINETEMPYGDAVTSTEDFLFDNKTAQAKFAFWDADSGNERFLCRFRSIAPGEKLSGVSQVHMQGNIIVYAGFKSDGAANFTPRRFIFLKKVTTNPWSTDPASMSAGSGGSSATPNLCVKRGKKKSASK